MSYDSKAGRLQRPNERKAAAVKVLVGVAFLFLVSLAWRLTPLRESVSFAAIIDWQQSLVDHPSAPFWVAGAYVLGGAVLFPVTILNLATIVTFGPVWGNAYAFAGWLCSAACGFGVGRVMGRELVPKLARSPVEQILSRAGRHGFLTVLSVRIVPVAPFTVVNLVIGASGIAFADFFLATMVGRIPGIVALTVFGFQLESFLRQPAVESLVILALALFLIPTAAAWLFKRFASEAVRRRNSPES